MSYVSKALASEPGLLALLTPDERLDAVVKVAEAVSGAEQITGTPPPPVTGGEPLSGAGRVVGAAAAGAAAALGPTGWSGGDLPMRALGGYRVVGDANSRGVALYRALGAAGTTAHLAVTDRRLLLVRGGLSAAGRQAEFTELLALPRTDVVAAQRRGRLGARGRVELYFRDGSMVAVMTGMLGTGPAQRLLAALEVPSSPPRP